MAAIPAVYLTGSGGFVEVDSNQVCITQFSANLTAAEIDVTSSCGSGWSEFVGGFKMLDGSATCVVKASGTGYPAISLGSVYAIVLHMGAGIEYTFNGLITGINTSLDIKGTLTYQLSFKSTGAVTGPAI